MRTHHVMGTNLNSLEVVSRRSSVLARSSLSHTVNKISRKILGAPEVINEDVLRESTTALRSSSSRPLPSEVVRAPTLSSTPNGASASKKRDSKLSLTAALQYAHQTKQREHIFDVLSRTPKGNGMPPTPSGERDTPWRRVSQWNENNEQIMTTPVKQNN